MQHYFYGGGNCEFFGTFGKNLNGKEAFLRQFSQLFLHIFKINNQYLNET